MPTKKTIKGVYYALNAAIIAYLVSSFIECPLYKYGIDPATLGDNKNTQGIKYPYLQTFYMNVKQNSRTSKRSGILTNFDYQISFYTSINDETANDEEAFIPFEAVKNSFSDVDLNIFGDIASILSMQEVPDFQMRSGMPVPSAVLICKMRAICAYVVSVPDSTISTDLESAISINEE